MVTVDKLVIKIGADVKSALTGIAAVESSISNMDKRVGGAAASIRKSTGKIVKAMAAIGVVGAAVATAGVIKATMVFADYEQAVTNAASVTGLSGQAYLDAKANIDSLAKTLGETTVFSAAQAANAMYDLASAGFAVSGMTTDDLEPILDLAAATQADLAFATETVTAALGQFGLGMDDTQRVSDVMAKSIGSSKATIDKLSISLRTVGPVANAMGIEIEETTALLGTMFNAGMMGEQAATGLKTAFAVLAAPSNVVQSAINDLGLTMDDVNPVTRDFTDILDTLRMSGASTSDIFTIFGREGAASINTLIANTDGIRELEATLRSAGGAAQDMADKQLATLSGAFTLLKSALEGLMISIGEFTSDSMQNMAIAFRDAIPAMKDLILNGLAKIKQAAIELGPTFDNMKSIFSSAVGIAGDLKTALFGTEGGTKKFTDAINTLTGALASVFAWIDEHPTITKLAATIGIAAAAFAFIMPVVVGVGSVIGTVISAVASLQLVFMTTTTTIGFISGALALLGGPITLIIGAVALLGAAWATNLFGIRDRTKDAFEAIKSIIVTVFNFIAPFVAKAINRWIKAFNLLVPLLKKVFPELEKIAEVSFDKIDKTVFDKTEKVKESIKSVADTTAETAAAVDTSTNKIKQSYDNAGKAALSFDAAVAASKQRVLADMSPEQVQKQFGTISPNALSAIGGAAATGAHDIGQVDAGIANVGAGIAQASTLASAGTGRDMEEVENILRESKDTHLASLEHQITTGDAQTEANTAIVSGMNRSAAASEGTKATMITLIGTMDKYIAKKAQEASGGMGNASGSI